MATTALRILVKISGDKITDSGLYEKLKPFDSAGNVITLVPGGGTQINEEYRRRGIPIRFSEETGRREYPTPDAEEVAYRVLLQNQERVQYELSLREFRNSTVVLPVECDGGTREQVNGDEYILRHSDEFDLIIVVTTPERHEAKAKKFVLLSKVTIWSFPQVS